MTEYSVEVYAPTLISRRAHFPAGDGLLYLPGEDLEAEMRSRYMIPRSAVILTERIPLGASEPDGRTKGGGGRGWHDLLHGVRLRFHLVSDHEPTKAEVRPWELKKVSVDEGAA